MIGPVFLLLAQAATAAAVPSGPPSEAVAKEMVEINSHLDAWNGGIYKKDGKLTCRINQSTGDAEIDMIRCGAMLRCYAPKVKEMDAIAASDAPEADRKRKMKAISESTAPCIMQAHRAGVRMLAEERVKG